MKAQYYTPPYYQPYTPLQVPMPQVMPQQSQQQSPVGGLGDLAGNAVKGGLVAEALPSAGASSAAFPVGTAINGGTLMSDGTIAAAGTEAAPLSGFSLAGAAPYVGVGLGALAIGKGLKDLLQGNKTKGLEGWGGRIGLGVATGGLSEVARAFGLGSHKSTRDVAKGHTSDLLSRNKDDARYQSYVSGMRKQYDSAPPDPSKPFAGKYATWDEYKKAGLQAGDLSGVYGNINTFGKDWTDLDQGQREKVTQALIDADLYQSKKGEVNITDQAKAQEIFKQQMEQLLAKR